MEIFLYAFSIMYSPGPVNVMGLNAGLTGQLRKSLGFFSGVGCAMFVLFLLFGYTGEAIISQAMLPYLSLAGGLYTSYLAYKVYTAKVELECSAKASPSKSLTFWNGFLIQALNPKGMLVVLPITSVMFPAAHISGAGIFAASLLIALGGAGAPGTYSLLGALLGKRIRQNAYFNLFNRLMGISLAVCAIFMLYDVYVHYQH